MPVEAVSPQLAPYIEAFERTEHNEAQRAAFERFLEVGFPNQHDEDWKFTNLQPLARTGFALAARDWGEQAFDSLVADLPTGAPHLYFVNGYFAGDELHGKSTGGARFEHFDEAEPRLADPRKPLIALNTAFFRESERLRIHIPAGKISTRPIYLVHLSLPGARQTFSAPRNLIVVEEGAQASIVECYLGTGKYFTNALTEIIAGDGAIVDHYKVQRESDDAFHISTIQTAQGRDSVVTSRSFAFGGALARTEINARLDRGSECTLNGLYLVNGRRHVDTRTTIDHAMPHATSHELYKGILDGQSSAVFNGKILVRKDAQKTDAKQTNKNLVLSEDATINTKPQLEIFADDVRCTHGATIGQLDAESIFYLRSRGIGHEEARRMLIEAFAREIIDGVKIEELREYLGRFL
jgi:Fe-S cluster assembly protein SufD